MPLVILSLSHDFAKAGGIVTEYLGFVKQSSDYLERVVNNLPAVVAPVLTSMEHPVSETDVEIWPQILHPLARTKFDVSIDIFTARDNEREADCQKRSDDIERALEVGFFPAGTKYCADIHLDIEGFATGLAR